MIQTKKAYKMPQIEEIQTDNDITTIMSSAPSSDADNDLPPTNPEEGDDNWYKINSMAQNPFKRSPF